MRIVPDHFPHFPGDRVRASTPAPKCATADDCRRHRPCSNRRFASERPGPPEPVGEATIGNYLELPEQRSAGSNYLELTAQLLDERPDQLPSSGWAAAVTLGVLPLTLRRGAFRGLERIDA